MEAKPMHILIVDDDINMLATMADILKAKDLAPGTPSRRWRKAHGPILT